MRVMIHRFVATLLVLALTGMFVGSVHAAAPLSVGTPRPGDGQTVDDARATGSEAIVAAVVAARGEADCPRSHAGSANGCSVAVFGDGASAGPPSRRQISLRWSTAATRLEPQPHRSVLRPPILRF